MKDYNFKNLYFGFDEIVEMDYNFKDLYFGFDEILKMDFNFRFYVVNLFLVFAQI